MKYRTLFEINRDATSQLELACAFALILRGSWMLYFGRTIPLAVQGLLIPGHWPESRWGTIFVCLGSLQCINAFLRVSGLWRWCVAAAAGIVQAIGWTAYYSAREDYRAVVPLIIFLTVTEMYLTWRGLSDWMMERTRRRNHVRQP